MPNTILKAQQIVSAAVGVLERRVVLPQLIWRDATIDNTFKLSKDDTVTIKIPAYLNSRLRVMRSGTGYTIDSFAERGVDVKLDTDVYKAIGITDEELTLDIASFGTQVLDPTISAVGRGMEDSIAEAMQGATYETSLALSSSDPYDTLIDARTALNNARVPMSERACAVGSNIEARMLKSEHLSIFHNAGDSQAFREAVIGRMAGFTVVSVPGMDPDLGYCFHRSAYIQANVAPAVPAGVPYGATASFMGYALRVIRDYDFANVRDRLLVNTYTGIGVTKDHGHFDTKGLWVPAEEADSDYDDDVVIRAVELDASALT